MKTRPLRAVPQELWGAVAQFLPMSGRVAVGQVDRHLRRVFLDPIIYADIFMQHCSCSLPRQCHNGSHGASNAGDVVVSLRRRAAATTPWRLTVEFCDRALGDAEHFCAPNVRALRSVCEVMLPQLTFLQRLTITAHRKQHIGMSMLWVFLHRFLFRQQSLPALLSLNVGIEDDDLEDDDVLHDKYRLLSPYGDAADSLPHCPLLRALRLPLTCGALLVASRSLPALQCLDLRCGRESDLLPALQRAPGLTALRIHVGYRGQKDADRGPAIDPGTFRSCVESLRLERFHVSGMVSVAMTELVAALDFPSTVLRKCNLPYVLLDGKPLHLAKLARGWSIAPRSDHPRRTIRASHYDNRVPRIDSAWHVTVLELDAASGLFIGGGITWPHLTEIVIHMGSLDDFIEYDEIPPECPRLRDVFFEGGGAVVFAEFFDQLEDWWRGPSEPTLHLVDIVVQGELGNGYVSSPRAMLPRTAALPEFPFPTA